MVTTFPFTNSCSLDIEITHIQDCMIDLFLRLLHRRDRLFQVSHLFTAIAF